MAAYRPLHWSAACTVFVCQAQRLHWVRRGGCSRRNVVIRNGVDTDAFRPDAAPEERQAARAALGLRPGDYVIGAAAALRPEKNLVLLVEAVAELRRRGIPARALLIGDGPSRPAIEAQARRLGVGALVTITGLLPDVRASLRACDTVALCSLTESLPLAALEAMALGRPVVHSVVGGAAEIVFPGLNGYLFPSGDARAFADRLADLADPGLRARMGESARRLAVARFSERDMVLRYERLLAELAAAGEGRRHGAAAPDRPAVLLLGPGLDAVSGVSAHLRSLIESALGDMFELVHFRVGSEGREESPVGRLARLAASPFALALAIRRTRAGIVHVNTSLNAGAFWRDLAQVLVARICGARVVCQIHGGALPQDFLRGLRPFRPLLRWALGRADLVVVLARAEQDAYRRFLPGRRIELVPNGVACSASARQPRAPDAPLALLYLGRLAPGKGLGELLRALAQLQDGGRPVARLAIAGSGPEEEALRAMARALALDGTVVFTGPLRGAAKVRLLSESDALVLASDAEGMPYALLEAMAAGLAVIATPVGAIPDLVTEGVHGLLVPPRDPIALANAVRALAADRARLARMGTAARARVREICSIERLAGRFAEIYGELSAPGVGWPSPAG